VTKQQTTGVAHPLKPWRAALFTAIAILSLQAPLAHADAFVGARESPQAKELNLRLAAMEQKIAEMAARQSAQPDPGTPGAPGGLNLPAPPGAPPIPISDDDLQLDYVVKGEVNGAVIVKVGQRVQVMQRLQFDQFSEKAKARARTQHLQSSLTSMAPGAPSAPPVSTFVTTPAPTPPAAAAAPAVKAPERNARAVKAHPATK
jgi:hypothetical protein